MGTRPNARKWMAVGALGALVAAMGCGTKGGRTDYSKSPDSGAVAPAAQIDTSLSRTYPDSTSGGPDRTGKRGATGDTLSTRGQPAGTGIRRTDTTNKARPNPKP